MNKAEKLKAKILAGQGFHNFAFADLLVLLSSLGFAHNRTAGSHLVFIHPKVPHPVSVQNFAGKAKPYQLRQVRDLIKEYDL